VSMSIDRAVAALKAAEKLSSLVREVIGLNDRISTLRLSHRRRLTKNRVRRKSCRTSNYIVSSRSDNLA
jgi:hypothetical protein